MRCHARPLSAFFHAVRFHTFHDARRVRNLGEEHGGSHGVSGLCVECADWLATDSVRVSYVGLGQSFIVRVSLQSV